MRRCSSYLLLSLTSIALLAAGPDGTRRPGDDRELRAWLENMVWYHRYTPDEIRAATGLKVDEIVAALKRFDIRTETRPPPPAEAPLLALPSPRPPPPPLA